MRECSTGAVNARKARGELAVVVSDNESWIDANVARGTATTREWNVCRSRNPEARLVLIDLQPYATSGSTSPLWLPLHEWAAPA